MRYIHEIKYVCHLKVYYLEVFSLEIFISFVHVFISAKQISLKEKKKKDLQVIVNESQSFGHILLITCSTLMRSLAVYTINKILYLTQILFFFWMSLKHYVFTNCVFKYLQQCRPQYLPKDIVQSVSRILSPVLSTPDYSDSCY